MKHDNVNASKTQVIQLAYNQALSFGYIPLDMRIRLFMHKVFGNKKTA